MAHITINFFEIEVFALFCGACPTIPKKKIKLDSRKTSNQLKDRKDFGSSCVCWSLANTGGNNTEKSEILEGDHVVVSVACQNNHYRWSTADKEEITMRGSLWVGWRLP